MSSKTIVLPEGRTHRHVTFLVCVPSQVAEQAVKFPVVHLQTGIGGVSVVALVVVVVGGRVVVGG
jgi:hypothetical protein